MRGHLPHPTHQLVFVVKKFGTLAPHERSFLPTSRACDVEIRRAGFPVTPAKQYLDTTGDCGE